MIEAELYSKFVSSHRFVKLVPNLVDLEHCGITLSRKIPLAVTLTSTLFSTNGKLAENHLTTMDN
eukprot:s2043_g6.t1